MGQWGFLSDLLDKVPAHSTAVGKVWITVLFIFRIMVLGAGVEKVWGDEQSNMVCNTRTPGCRNVCYDHAFPISHVRFWVLQILCVSTPSLVYLGYVLHVIHREKKLRRLLQDQAGRQGLKAPKYTDGNGKVSIQGSVLCSYLTCLVFTILLETAFIVGQYLLYSFHMEPLIQCARLPCPLSVHCFMSRPTEKTIFIIFMLVVACVSLLLNVAEFFYLIGRRSRKQTLAEVAVASRPRRGTKTTLC